jgi:hypothetical protein
MSTQYPNVKRSLKCLKLAQSGHPDPSCLLVFDLLSVAVPRVLAVEAALLVTAAVVHPAVAVAVQAAHPPLPVAVAAGDAACNKRC